jgi:energy-converting hydrogenase Eha subunit C
VSLAACAILAGGGVAVLGSMGLVRGAWLLGLTQGLCLVLSASVAGAVREALRREPAWQLALSWVLSAGFIAGVVALYWAGRAFWAELLIAGVTVLYVASVGLVVFFPGLMEREGADDDGDERRSGS